MANELYKNILQRFPAAIILVFFIFGVLYLQNISLILSLVIAAGFLLIKEWLTLSELKVNLKQIIFFVTLVLFSIFYTKGFIDFFLLIISSFWFIYGFYLILNKSSSFFSFDNNYLGLLLVLGFVYGFIYLIEFSEFNNINKFFILFVILFNTVLADVGAYLVGSSIGRTPLFPEISPNKTVEGLLGGIGFVVIFLSAIYFYNLISFDLVLVSLISLPFAFIGDYFESQLKRDKSIKDSGSLIPGHGGIWDRLDSHIAVVPIFVLLTNLLA
ncbi:phosphatidate cytidylyltransferase [Pseudomonadota bacterium]|nr:phosphatidate cytidylyltransferase [Pseudomonadota bacterium]